MYIEDYCMNYQLNNLMLFYLLNEVLDFLLYEYSRWLCIL